MNWTSHKIQQPAAHTHPGHTYHTWESQSHLTSTWAIRWAPRSTAGRQQPSAGQRYGACDWSRQKGRCYNERCGGGECRVGKHAKVSRLRLLHFHLRQDTALTSRSHLDQSRRLSVLTDTSELSECQKSLLTLWHPLLLYRYSYKASCARPG